MAVRFQIVIDCRDPEPLAPFWVAALGYDFEPPPEGFATWDDYWRDVGVGEKTWGSARTGSSIQMAAARASGSRWYPN